MQARQVGAGSRGRQAAIGVRGSGDHRQRQGRQQISSRLITSRNLTISRHYGGLAQVREGLDLIEYRYGGRVAASTAMELALTISKSVGRPALQQERLSHGPDRVNSCQQEIVNAVRSTA